ncbi:MAG: hypothetical protein K2P81_04290 [Bacteriovoracaceae bacterium]|nr:hypothetical protein [Bacteriovoracaceae bacterium]
MRFVSLFLVIFSFHAAAQIRPYQTTRLLSTAGAGVASMLVSESAVLNPAPLAFFSNTFVSYQNTSVDLKSPSTNRTSDGRDFSDSSRHEGYFIFDNASALKGGFSYQYQRENGFVRKRGTVTMASQIAENMSFGVLYKYTQDKNPSWQNGGHKVSHPVTLGFSWIPMNQLILGLVWDDPGKAIKNESRVLGGVQYSLSEKLVFLGDAGVDPTKTYKDSQIWRAAIQFNAFADFFIRGGRFQDKAQNLEGTGWGASWTGPKLGIDFAMKNARQIRKEISYLYPDERINEFSFSLNVQF